MERFSSVLALGSSARHWKILGKSIYMRDPTAIFPVLNVVLPPSCSTVSGGDGWTVRIWGSRPGGSSYIVIESRLHCSVCGSSGRV